jgi:hypothetical protein
MGVAQEQTVLGKIRTRGYWRAVIRPATFEQNHVGSWADPFSIVEKHSVRFRGRGYPTSPAKARSLWADAMVV